MRYKLTDGKKLRGWLFNLYTLVRDDFYATQPLSVPEFRLLSQCDGKQDVDELDPQVKELLNRFLQDGVIAPCEAGETIETNQEYRFHNCWQFDKVNWAITSHCNYKCRHCFSAADASPMIFEPTLQQCFDFIDQLESCGVRHLRITGGEPLLRKDFLELTQRVAERGIVIDEIATNTSLLTEELLDQLEAQGHKPGFYVSFDGIGHHDWLRNVLGSEEVVLDKIRMLVRRGYFVKVEPCLWRGNLDTLRESTRLLADIGVDEVRFIRVAESPRWLACSEPGDSLTPQEYVDVALDYVDWYLVEQIPMKLEFWSLFRYTPGMGFCNLVPAHVCTPEKEATQPCCGDARQMPFVAGNGDLSLCNPISGYLNAAGINMGNVFETPLEELFRESPFTDQLLVTWAKIRAHNEECQTCEWRKMCAGGCRAIALAITHDIRGRDMMTCNYFKSGQYDKWRDLAAEHGLRPMPDISKD